MANHVYLEKIIIKDMFHSFDIEWDLKRDVNILGGKNGDGKSTILRALYELLFFKRIASEKLKNIIGEIYINFSNSFVLERIKGTPDQICLKESQKLINYSVEDGWMVNGVYEGELDERFVDEFLQKFPHVIYINSFEQIVANAESLRIESSINDEEKTYLDVLIEKELNKRNAMFADAVTSLFHKLSRRNDISDFANSDKISEFFELYRRIQRFMSSYASEIGNDLTFIRHDSRNQDRIPFTRLSMGEKQLLLVLMMASNTRKQNYVFIMDEPDLGMHIQWKEILLKELRQLNPNMQMILSTHSPSVIEGWFDNVLEISQIKR